MKKLLPLLLLPILFIGQPKASMAQKEFGVSFSYLFPRGGYFTSPVAPLSIRGLGVKFNDYISLASGISWYQVGGMDVKGLPFETKGPIVGPFSSFLVPLELEIKFPIGNTRMSIHGGIFTYYNAGMHLHTGNLERSLREHTGWTTLNAYFGYDKNNFGFGYHWGAKHTFWVTDQAGAVIGANYYLGDSDLNLDGSYTGVPESGDEIQSRQVRYEDSEIDWTGLELKLGVVIKQ